MTERWSFSPAGIGTSERRASLIGRSVEMRQLDDALGKVREDGKARVVTVLGSTGIGKTRLVRDFLVKSRVSGQAAARVYRGASRDQDAAYGVIARLLRARFGLVEGMDPDAARAQIRAQLATVLEDRKVGDVAFFLGQLLELEFPRSPLITAIETDSKQIRQVRHAVLKGFWEADARSSAKEASRPPLVLVFDDLQWAHEESLELLAYLVDGLDARALIIAVGRPELMARRDDWLGKAPGRHTVIELSPLSEMDASAVMHDLLSPCGDEAATEELVDAACNLAGGNPALLEQMLRIYLDLGVLEPAHVDELTDEDRWIVHLEKMDEVKLPLTVEDAVTARIATLTQDERDVLERAATVGSVFWLGGLVALFRLAGPVPAFWRGAGEPDIARIRGVLQELRERDYIIALPDSTFAGDEEYAFKHNLEREKLVKLTPPATARSWHATLADWLSHKDNVRSHEEYVAMLARHREKAGRITQAAATWLDAADVARSRYANVRAAEYYAKALALAVAPSAGKPCAEIDAEARMRAAHHHGEVLQALGRNDEAMVAFRDMLAHAYRLDLRTKGGAAHSRIGRLHREMGELPEAKQRLDAALVLFEASADERGIASTVDDLGKLAWLRGDYDEALEQTQRALTMRRALGDTRSIALSLNNLGMVYQDSGHLKLALDAFEQALRIRREIGDLIGVSVSLNNLGTVAQDQRDDARALALFQEAFDVAKETGDRNRLALILTNLGETYTRLGDGERAVRFLKQAEHTADELGDRTGLAEAARGLAKAYLVQRDFTKARECAGRAVEIFRSLGSKVQLGVGLRALGEVSSAASAGGEGLRAALAQLGESVAVLTEAKNEVELARSLRALAAALRAGAGDLGADGERLALEHDTRAESIAARLKMSGVPGASGPISHGDFLLPTR